MPVLTAVRPPAPLVPTRAIVFALLAGIGFVAGGLVLGYFAFGTGFLDRFTDPRPTASQMVAGALAWTFALIAPALFMFLGLAKFYEMAELVSYRRRPPRPATAVVRSLPDDHVVASRVQLPDGRVVPELVIGPFGVAVIEELPPKAATRHRSGRWEVRRADGRWLPIENPLDRAERDAERVRRWLAHEDHDHVVKVYAAVVAPDTELPRSPGCAVTTPEQLPGWLGSLPVQRSLFPERQARVVELIRTRLG